jgi:DNA-binding FrmR family transcriptional regulator
MATAKKMAHVVQDEQALADVTKRLRRAEGQIGGILRMLDEGRSCEDVVMQLAAVSKAIDKAAFSLITAGLRECIAEGKNNADDVAQQLQRLFLTMA